MDLDAWGIRTVTARLIGQMAGLLPAITGPLALWAPGRPGEDADMEFGVVVTTVILFALLLATAGGYAAARILMHAADTGTGSRPDDR